MAFDQSDLLDRYVVVRCADNETMSGYLTYVSGKMVVLKKSRRLWEWTLVDGISLNGVADKGLAPTSKLSYEVDYVVLTNVIEIVTCSDYARDIILRIPSFSYVQTETDGSSSSSIN